MIRVLSPEPVRGGRSITYADLATALLDVLACDELQRRGVYAAN